MAFSSTSDFNSPEFPDYDPTPYDGGYDLAATYGTPLPPSDFTCYPHSISDPNLSSPEKLPLPNGSISDPISSSPKKLPNGPISDPISSSPKKLPNGSISLPYGNEEVDNTVKPINEVQQQPCGDNDNWFNEANFWYGDYGFGTYEPAYDWPGFSNGYGKEEYGYDYGRQEPKPPCAPNDMNFCASLFGYWPCLYKEVQKSHGHGQQVAAEEQNYDNQWKGTVDYLFGSSYPCGYETRDGRSISYGNPSYGYERHYQEQPLYIEQKEYQEPLWVENLSYYGDYQEDVAAYPLPNYGENLYEENSEHFHFHQGEELYEENGEHFFLQGQYSDYVE